MWPIEALSPVDKPPIPVDKVPRDGPYNWVAGAGASLRRPCYLGPRHKLTTVWRVRARGDVQRFLADLRERFAKFGAEMQTGRMRLIEPGQQAARSRAPLPHLPRFRTYLQEGGDRYFWVERKTTVGRAKPAVVKDRLRRCGHLPLPEQGQWLGSVVREEPRVLCRAWQHRCRGAAPHPGDKALVSRRHGVAASAFVSTGC
jgi:hypothetical protein